MKTASVRDLRHHFGELLTWIKEGQEIKITMRRQVIARLVPERPGEKAAIKMPDFASRLKKIHGQRSIPAAAARAILGQNKGKQSKRNRGLCGLRGWGSKEARRTLLSAISA